MTAGSPPHLGGGEEVASLVFSELHEFSNIVLGRLEPGYTGELIQGEGNKSPLIAIN